jgi:non-lysosomal glucosylceramidase
MMRTELPHGSQNSPRAAWPILKTYADSAIERISLPLGGIGTGTLGLGGRGNLQDWEIVNRPAKGFAPDPAFFAVRIAGEGQAPIGRALEGPIPLWAYEGEQGSRVPHAGLPRFRSARFETTYPFGQVVLEDPDLPVSVRIQAFNPLVPCDLPASSLPIAVLRFVVTNLTDAALDVSICGTVRNFIGTDGSEGAPRGNRNEPRSSDGLTGLLLRSDGVDPRADQWGTLALAVRHTDAVTRRTAWADRSWGDSLLDFWDDFLTDGRLEDRQGTKQDPVASLATPLHLGPQGETGVTFLLAWHFPNRRAWYFAGPGPRGGFTDDIVGNHYATLYEDAWDVVRQAAGELDALEARTLEFVSAFCAADLAPVVKEAALFNLSTLRTQTCFRTADGRFYGWEGCLDNAGSCPGSCTHVWNYEQATAFLFGELARSMREVEFAHATDARGLMSFRVLLPLTHAQDWNLAAADGQMGCIMKLYRDWQLSGDETLLRALWPHARRALQFAWIPGGWDADQDGVMEGCQHNTMDVEFYGPSAWMNCWYLGALLAAAQMAAYLGEGAFAATCRRLYEQGSRWMDTVLFDGEYYPQQVRPPEDFAAIASGLRHQTMGAGDPHEPELQLGQGCAVDQFAGQFLAFVLGFGPLLDHEHIATAQDSILRYNRRASFFGHFNHMRSYVLGDECALLMAAYPKDRPARPFPYFNEVMTGFEYAFAGTLVYMGRTEDAMAVVQAIRERYDGERRNPFDEAECGHHYARAMASWALVPALTGFSYSAVERRMTFARAAEPVQWFWSTGDAWGTCAQRPHGTGVEVTIRVLGGTIAVEHLTVSGLGTVATNGAPPLLRGDDLSAIVSDATEEGR